MLRLTKRSVDQAIPTPGQRVFLRDEELKGFGLVVLPSGVKSYFVEYRLPGGRSAAKGRISIGKHGSPWTPELARREAAEILTQVRRGVDPRQARKINTDLTFETYVEGFLARAQSLRSVKHMAMIFRVHITPTFRNTQIGSISRIAISKLVSDVAAQSPATGRYVHAILGRLFRTAVGRGDIASSPMQDMEPPPLVPSRDRVLTDSELARLWRATYELSDLTGAAIRLLILTGQRRSEVFGMSSEELDLTSNTWTIPAKRAKNNIAHVVPLSKSALTELASLGVMTGRSGLIFTTTGTTPISGISKIKVKLDSFMDGIPPWRLHDIRRTVATGLQRLGVRFEVTEAVLNHVSGAKSGVAGVYQRHDWLSEKRNALEAWARNIEGLVADISSQNNIIRLTSA
jgi:integrase